MDSFVAKVGLSAAFGEAREATVKNVGKPLSFRPLIDVEKLKPGAKE
jgi:hypothetical protein